MNISKQAREAAQECYELCAGQSLQGPKMIVALKDIIQSAIDAHEAAQWRPVSEPPSEGGSFLVSHGADCTEAIWNPEYRDWTGCGGLSLKPTRWRELPQPPKE